MKYVNFVGIGASDMVYIELACMLDNNKHYSEKYCMTFDKLKQLQEVVNTTVAQCEAKMAKLKLAN